MKRIKIMFWMVTIFVLGVRELVFSQDNPILFQDEFSKEKISSEWKTEGRWTVIDGSVTNIPVEKPEEKYYTGRISIGNKDWKIEKIEFDFKRIEPGIPTKYGFDNHTGVRIWGLTIWARENCLQWSGHIPPIEGKPVKTEKKEANFELNKWYHFRAERLKDGKVQVFINEVLFTTIPFSPEDKGEVSFYTYRIRSAFDNIKIYGIEGD
ncbi:MAG: hypothetical protein NC899_07040, partial [Candidatus Omnitrophica bacterium]|nr:hypothetical protein [Candidatus Omnitrophota bacterium]